MRNGTPYYDLFVGSSNLTGAALNTQREWNLKVSSLANGELVAQVRDEIDSQIADSKPLTEEWIKQYEEDFKKYAPARMIILFSLCTCREDGEISYRSPVFTLKIIISKMMALSVETGESYKTMPAGAK